MGKDSIEKLLICFGYFYNPLRQQIINLRRRVICHLVQHLVGVLTR
jgi:hypothetical protein